MRKLTFLLIVVLAFFLRFYRLDQVPPSLYWDETSLGYNAFSIAQTLRDEHGVFLPVSNFAAFGDYKAPGYIYAIVPFIKLFGLSEVSVRLPSALAGTLLVLVTYFLVLELGQKKRVAMLAALFVAVSPWSLQMSRAGFEANLATIFSVSGALFFLHAVHRKTSKFYILSSMFFVFSMYTFNSHRIFSPILAAGLSLIFIKEILHNLKKSFVFYLLSVVLLLPLVPHLLSPEGQLRFNEVSWINNLDIVKKSNATISQYGNAPWAKVVFNRRVFYIGEFVGHYLDHYRFDFLFLNGDINPRLSVRSTGEMYLLELPFLVLGIVYLIRRRDKTLAVLLFWLLVAPIPAAFARETPHALRILDVLPVPQIISAVGLAWILTRWRRILPIFIALISMSVVFYLKSYYLDYPQKYDMDWQYGYKQAVQYVASIQKDYSKVNVTGFYGRPYIYFLFYNNYPPEKYWANRDAHRDQFGFWVVNSFDIYNFSDNLPSKTGKTLYVDKPEVGLSGKKLLKTIYDLNSQPVFLVSESL